MARAAVAAACVLLAAACTQLEDSKSDRDTGVADARAGGPDDEDAAGMSDDDGSTNGSDSGAADAAVALGADASAAQDAGEDQTDAAHDAGMQASADHCAAAPCVHGTCTSGSDSFSCRCSGPWAGTRCDKPTFQPLGTITGMTESEARAVSADGSVVVGQASRSTPSSASAAIQWKATTGLVQLPSGENAVANAVAGDGLTVVGYDRSPGSSIGYAARWTGGAKDSGYQPPLVNNMLSSAHAHAISADGKVAVGTGDYVNDYPKAVRWVDGTGMIERIDPSGHEESYARGVSGDGSVVVGYSYNPDTAFVWRAGDTGVTALPSLDASRGSGAYGVSQDGKVIVGSSGGLAVRWVNGAAPLSLGLSGVAYGANADGSVIVGRTGTAFVWRSNANPQLQLLADLLLTDGAELTGWTLDQLSAVSADGSTAVGHGIHNGSREGFIARLR